LRTININLIENKNKPVKIDNSYINDIDGKTKSTSIIIVVSACIVFAICVCIWFVAFYLNKKADSDLTELKSRHENLKIELAESTSSFKDLQQEKKNLELKLLAQNQINDSLLPWYYILNDIAGAVPKDIKILKIEKAGLSSANDSTSAIKLDIEGQISSLKRSGQDPLKEVSFFVININENPSLNSYLSNAVLKSVKYEDKSQVYNFIIETCIKLPEIKTEEKEEK
jgi:hypothetical protein